MKKSTKAKRLTRTKPLESTPAPRESDLILKVRSLSEVYPMHQLVRNSYVLSRFWAWFSQIQLNPKVRIPVPRFLTYRDP